MKFTISMVLIIVAIFFGGNYIHQSNINNEQSDAVIRLQNSRCNELTWKKFSLLENEGMKLEEAFKQSFGTIFPGLKEHGQTPEQLSLQLKQERNSAFGQEFSIAKDIETSIFFVNHLQIALKLNGGNLEKAREAALYREDEDMNVAAIKAYQELMKSFSDEEKKISALTWNDVSEDDKKEWREKGGLKYN